jgi:DNA repair exonuclease SbcCD ATPase subunit
MKIRRVKLINYAQHKNLDIEIESNFVGIIGENGSGKSNFINAISDAITGEFHKKKSLIVSHGEKNGNILIEGEFDYQEDFTLTKSLSGSETTLKIGDAELIGADLVNAKILERLECDKSFLSNMVFVKQEDILGIIFGRPAERNKLLQRFFGLERAQKIDVALSSWASTIPESVEINESLVVEEMKATEEVVKETTQEIDGLREELKEVTDDISSNEDLIEKVVELYERAKAYETASTRIESLKEDEKKLKASIVSLGETPVTKEEIRGLQDQLSSIKEKIASLVDLKNFLESARATEHMHTSDNKCAVCGSALDEDAEKRIEDKIALIDRKIEAEKKIGRKFPELIKEKSEKFDEYNDSKSLLNKRLDYVTSQLEALGISQGAPTKRPSAEYKEALDEHSSKKSLESNLKTKIDALNRALETYGGTIKRCQDALVLAAKAKKENEALRIHKRRVSRLQSLFKHSGSATEIYVNTKMKRMCSCINEYLSGFGAAYRVRVDRDNEFICQFPGKTIMSGELSGGQKVVLSLAFRFAACELFTSKTNLIVLDEPTTWLDKKRIDSFGDILADVKSMSQKRNLQVFIVTHEKSLMSNFDQVVEF